MRQGADLERQVREIAQELEELKITQARSNEVIQRLERKIINLSRDTVDNRVPTGESKVTLEQLKRLIGRKVRIVNPHRGEPDVGIVSGVGKLYVTVKLTEELSRNRQAKNLRLIHYHEGSG